MANKVNNKAALKRAWRMIKVKGIDKKTAFDLAWRMERGEIPKVRTAEGNRVVRVVSLALAETLGALRYKADEYSVKASCTANAQVAGGYKAAETRYLNKHALVCLENDLKWDGEKYVDAKDPQVQVVISNI